MLFPLLTNYTDIALLLIRLMLGLIFCTSGWKHLTSAEARSKDIGLSKGFTLFLGAAECAGALGVAFGVLTQLAAIGLIVVMLGAIQKKIATWHTGFWGKHGTDGWSYDLIMILMNLLVVTTAGGHLVLDKLLHFSN
jgi:putative oxidoreductase